MNIGELNINKLYIGETEISKIYLGTALVYQNTVTYVQQQVAKNPASSQVGKISLDNVGCEVGVVAATLENLS